MISVVIPITNRLNLFKRSLPTLLKQNYPIDKWELVVVDRGSTDGLVEYLKSLDGLLHMTYLKIDVAKSPVPVFGEGVGVVNPSLAWNIGIRKAVGDKIMLTSPEVIHWTNTLEQGEKNCCNNRIVIALVLDQTTPETDISFIDNNTGLGCLVSSGWRQHDAGLYFIGVVPKVLFEWMHGIDEEYMRGLSWEDTDTGRRMIAAGGKLVHADDMIGLHQWHERVDIYGDGGSINQKRFYGGFNVVANHDHQWGDFGCIIEEWRF